MDDRIREVERRYEELSSLLSDPATIADPKRLREYSREQAKLTETVRAAERYHRLRRELAETRELLADATIDAEMSAMAQHEGEHLAEELAAHEEKLKRLLIPRDPLDDRDAVVEVRAGTGGDEAALFAGELFRMYTRFAESRGWKVEMIGVSDGSQGGVKEAIFVVRGADAYGELRYESGVHRVQRVPATENQGRIHTSAATVAVLPEAEEVDVQINDNELKIDVYRSSGPGGQSVNTTDSAVRITHLPTGLVVTCQDEKSQHKNKDKALGVLRSRLLDLKISEQETARARDRRLQVGTGDRSAKIRTYNFPQSRVTDHRIGYTTHALQQVLGGDLRELIERLRLAGQEEKSGLSTAMASRVWTVLEMVRWTTDYLAEKGIQDPRLNAELLLSGVLRLKRLDLYLQFDRPLQPLEIEEYRSRLKRRARHEPLQYISGYAEFRELRLRVDRRVLIPRPETEVLVGEVLAWARGRMGASVLDLGTGSGAIALSLATEGDFGRVVAVDVSPEALELARENSARVPGGDRVDLRLGNLFGAVTGERFDVVVSNPPYVAERERETLDREVRDWEPATALFSGADGLDLLTDLVRHAPDHLVAGGLLALEFGAAQAHAVSDLIRATGRFAEPRIRRDLAGRDRIALAELL